MPSPKKAPQPKRQAKPRQEKAERVVTMPDGQRMRSTLAQMQKARSLPLLSPQRPPAPAPRQKASLLRPSSR